LELAMLQLFKILSHHEVAFTRGLCHESSVRNLDVTALGVESRLGHQGFIDAASSKERMWLRRNVANRARSK
jgi:hypothetical protein